MRQVQKIFLTLSFAALVLSPLRAQAANNKELLSKVMVLFPKKILTANKDEFSWGDARKMKVDSTWSFYFQASIAYQIADPSDGPRIKFVETAWSPVFQPKIGELKTNFTSPVFCFRLNKILGQRDQNAFQRIYEIRFVYNERYTPEDVVSVDAEANFGEQPVPITLGNRSGIREKLDFELIFLDEQDPLVAMCPK